MFGYPDPMRVPNPVAWPQYLFDKPPATPECSQPIYSYIQYCLVDRCTNPYVRWQKDCLRRFSPLGSREKIPCLGVRFSIYPHAPVNLFANGQ